MTLSDNDKYELKGALWRLFRYLLLFAGCGWFVYQFNFAKSAQAAVTAPSVKRFTYTDAFNEKYSVTSWFEDGVKCTSVTTEDPTSNSNSRSVSVSCVKL